MSFLAERYSFLLDTDRPITSKDYVKVGEINYCIKSDIVMISKGYKTGKSLQEYIEELKQIEGSLRRNRQIDSNMESSIRNLLRNIEKTLDLVDEE